jgi:hypothetical protein
MPRWTSYVPPEAAPVNGGEFRKRICAALMIPESLDDEAVITTVELTDYEFRRLFAESVNGGERELRALSDKYQKMFESEDNPNVQRILVGMRDGLSLAASIVAGHINQRAADAQQVANKPATGSAEERAECDRIAALFGKAAARPGEPEQLGGFSDFWHEGPHPFRDSTGTRDIQLTMGYALYIWLAAQQAALTSPAKEQK